MVLNPFLNLNSNIMKNFYLKEVNDIDNQPPKVLKKRKKEKRRKIRKPKKIWSKEEDDLLLALIEQYGPSKWSIIASFMQER